MIFTKEDFLKIEEYLKQKGVKDSEFDLIEAVTGQEAFPVLTIIDEENPEQTNAIMTLSQLKEYFDNTSILELEDELGEYFKNYLDTLIWGGYTIETVDGKAPYNGNYSSLVHGYVDWDTGSLRSHDQYRRFYIANNGFIKISVKSCNPIKQSETDRKIAAVAFLYASGVRRVVESTLMRQASNKVIWYNFDLDIPEDVTAIYVVIRSTNTKATVQSRLDTMQIILTLRVDRYGIGHEVEVLQETTEEMLKEIDELSPEYMKLKYKPLLLSQEVSSVDKAEVPNYFFENPDIDPPSEETYYLENKLMNLPEGKHFIFITDTHWKYNTKKSLGIILYVRKRANIPYVVFGGDIIHRPCNVETETSPGIWHLSPSQYVQDTAQARQKIHDELRAFMVPAKEKFGNKFLPTYGNHDRGLANLSVSNDHYTSTDITNIWLSYEDYIKMAHSSIRETVTYDEQGIRDLDVLDITDDVKADLTAAIKLNYYTDDTLNKLRFIVVNTGISNTRTTDGVTTYFDGVYQDVFGLAGADCPCIALKLVAKALLSLPQGYDVVLVGHWFTQAKDTSSTGYQYRNGSIFLLRVVYAYLRENPSFTVPIRGDTKAAFTQWMNASSRVFDFTTANRGRVFSILGHRHVTTANVLTYNTSSWSRSTSTKYVATQTIIDEETQQEIIAPLYPYNEDEAARLKLLLCIVTLRDGVSGSVPANTSTGGTINTDCAFDIVTISDDNRVFCTRIGAGSDRELVLPYMTPEEFYQLYPPPVPPEPPVDPDDPDEDDEDEDQQQSDHITVIGEEVNILVVQGIDEATMADMVDPTQAITLVINLIMPDDTVWTVRQTVLENQIYPEYYQVRDSEDTIITNDCTAVISQDDPTKLELVAPVDIDFSSYLTT